IPYHYRPRPLYEQWSYRLNRQGKANENLGYRSSAWNTSDLFVRYPLNYDLEPYNFLRIEGHVGQNFQVALADLLSQKDANRLPIDIVALKTGYDSGNIPLPEDLEGCHFEDLQSLYRAFREEMLCQICEMVKHLYNLPYPPNSEEHRIADRAPRLNLLQECAPTFRYYTNTIGAEYERRFDQIIITNVLIDQPTIVIPGLFFFFNITNYVNFITTTITQLRNLAIVLPEHLVDLDLASVQSRYQAILDAIEPFNRNLIFDTNDADEDTGNSAPIDLEELSDQLDHFLYACKLETFQQIHQEYQRRLERIREQLLLSNFARKHPGLQHKAGVPMGGTFVMVYHGDNQQDQIPTRPGPFTLNGRVLADGEALIGANVFVVGTSRGTTTDVEGSFQIRVDELPVRLRVNFPGFTEQSVFVSNPENEVRFDLSDPDGGQDAVERFGNLAAGTVIADFYLPYLCCSDCASVQFVLPTPPPSFNWEQRGCTNPNNGGQIVLMPTGGTPPYEYSTNSGQSWQAIGEEPIDVDNGVQIQIRDAAGAESTRRTIELRAPLQISQVSEPDCNADGTEYSVAFAVSGGQAPYFLETENDRQTILGTEPAVFRFASGSAGSVRVTDSSEPACEAQITIAAHTCETPCGLPCRGITREVGYPMWIQRPAPRSQMEYLNVNVGVKFLNIFLDTGETIEIDPAELTNILIPTSGSITRSNYTSTWNRAFGRINELIARVSQEQLGIEHPLLRLSLDQDRVQGLSVLRIEHYECHRFEFNLGFSYVSSLDERTTFERSLVYNQEEYVVSERVSIGGQAIIPVTQGVLPAFDEIRYDHCNPEQPPRVSCEEPISVDFRATVLTDRPGYNLRAVGPRTLPILWIIEHSVPAMTSERRVVTQFQPNTPYQLMLLTVDPNTTCPGFVSEELSWTNLI
ncbi:MAG: hypothetical protein D6772_09225, partial [Bacteroidetes bacterium]